MKKIISIILCLVLIAGLASCGKKNEASTLAGGWELQAKEAVKLPENSAVQEAFKKVAVDKNADLVPVALVGTQVVAGTNYMFLCNEKGAYKMVVVYRSLDGNAEITQKSAFELTDYTGGESKEPAEQLAGGWAAPDDITVLPIPENAEKALVKALGSFVGSDIEPMALLGTQVVAGTNYALLCRVTPVVPNAVSTIQIVTVYADLQGNAEFTNFCALDHAKYNK